MRVLGVIAVLLLLAGCVSSPDSANVTFGTGYDQVLAKTKLVQDPHTGWTEVLGPVVIESDQFSRHMYLVRTRFEQRQGELRQGFQIQAVGLFPRRVYLNDVFSEGRKLKSKVIDRERRDCGPGCTTVETVGINLTEAEMEDYARRGITFEVLGRRDKIVVTIPASYFAAVLDFHRRQLSPSPDRNALSRSRTRTGASS